MLEEEEEQVEEQEEEQEEEEEEEEAEEAAASDICHPVKIFESCPDTSLPFYTNYVYFFIIGLSLMGIAVVPLYILGKTFIDDNCEAYSSGTLIGIAETTTVTGFYIGTALGGLQVRISLESVVDKTQHEEYAVAEELEESFYYWCFYFMVAICTTVLLSTFITSYSKYLNDVFVCYIGTVTKTDEKNQQHSSDVELKVKLQESKSSIKDLFASLWLLMKNAVFLCLALARAAEYSLFGAITLFLPTYITNQYDLSADVATMISGFVLLPGGGIGQLMGGVIISKLKMTCKDMMKFVMATSAITVLLILPISLIKCENVKFAGVTENYEGTGQLGNLTAPCNSHCSCSASFYSPVCGRDNIEYFSPCFAGCLESKSTSSRKLYYNCSCITKGFLKEDIQGYFNDAELMKCDIKCYKLPLVISFILSSSLFCSLANVPLIVSMLRVVSQNHHSLALAVAYLILRILGMDFDHLSLY
ncbi:solute carrier organic anion transporter family member 6A1 [Tenrec ecaudatus]|uniref:solute carrier organic anion transporter family member 6A1 n=1 Tax=Tenrec ecaudatus TaxID=94439 RepID=UPI003F5AADC2